MFMTLSDRLVAQIKPRVSSMRTWDYTKKRCTPKSAYRTGYLKHKYIPHGPGLSSKWHSLVSISSRRHTTSVLIFNNALGKWKTIMFGGQIFFCFFFPSHHLYECRYLHENRISGPWGFIRSYCLFFIHVILSINVRKRIETSKYQIRMSSKCQPLE